MMRLEFSRKTKAAAYARSQGKCEACGVLFTRQYRVSKARAAKPQYCSKLCLSKRLQAKIPIEERFWSRVEIRGPDMCWLWNGRKNPSGYGLIDRGGSPRLAHRVAYEISSGNDPGELFVCHSCDRPACCNPKHLWVGTCADNVYDMIKKGRNSPIKKRIGSDVNTSKLSELQALEILESPKSASILAAEFGVTDTAVRSIRNGKNWKHLSIKVPHA